MSKLLIKLSALELRCEAFAIQFPLILNNSFKELLNKFAIVAGPIKAFGTETYSFSLVGRYSFS